MLRRLALRASREPGLRKLAMSTPGFRDLAWRLVAGEDLEAGLTAVLALNGHGIEGTINALGFHVVDEAEARAGMDNAIEALRRIRAAGLRSHVSVKLTGIGLEIDEDLCREQLARILDCARETGGFVRIDMEESPFVETTMRIYREMAERYGDQTVGIVIQSYLRNPPYDLLDLAERGASIRLVKGGYRESDVVVLRERREVDAAFQRDIEILLRHATNPAIATHDPESVAWTVAIQRDARLPVSAFEFQLLYGVRTDLQLVLVRSGYRVRSYVPYGGMWLNWLLLTVHAAWHVFSGRLRQLGGGRG